MLIVDGREVVGTPEATKMFNVSGGYLRTLFQRGEVGRVEPSPRCVFYFLDDLTRVLSEKESIRKKRGGRPRGSLA